MRPFGLLLPAFFWAAGLAAQVRDNPEAADTMALADTTEVSETVVTMDEAEPKTPWRTSYFPYITGGANDGPVLAFRVHHFQPAEYEDRVTANAAFTSEAGITSRGSRHLILRFRAPQLWENWRVRSLAAAGREARFGYFGLGNETTQNKDLVTEAQPFTYRVRRVRYGGQLDVTRRIRGPLPGRRPGQRRVDPVHHSSRTVALPNRFRAGVEGDRRVEQSRAGLRHPGQ